MESIQNGVHIYERHGPIRGASGGVRKMKGGWECDARRRMRLGQDRHGGSGGGGDGPSSTGGDGPARAPQDGWDERGEEHGWVGEKMSRRSDAGGLVGKQIRACGSQPLTADQRSQELEKDRRPSGSLSCSSKNRLNAGQSTLRTMAPGMI